MHLINSTDVAVASSPGADVSGVALILLCQLFGFMKEFLRVRTVSINSEGYDDDRSVEKQMTFSDVECGNYRSLTRQ